jgi:hypothetical protein
MLGSPWCCAVSVNHMQNVHSSNRIIIMFTFDYYYIYMIYFYNYCVSCHASQGFHDTEYKKRRLMIADIALNYRM